MIWKDVWSFFSFSKKKYIKTPLLPNWKLIFSYKKKGSRKAMQERRKNKDYMWHAKEPCSKTKEGKKKKNQCSQGLSIQMLKKSYALQ